MNIQTFFSVVFLLLPFIIAFGALVVLQKKGLGFAYRVLIALILGVLSGVIINQLVPLSFVQEGSKDLAILWINLVATAFTSLLKLIIAPLVFISILTAIINLEITKNLRKSLSSIISILLITATISAIVGISVALLFNLDSQNVSFDQAVEQRIEEVKSEEVQSKTNLSIPEKIGNMVPSNFFQDLSGTKSTSTLGIVIFSTLLGLGFLMVRKKDEAEASSFQKGVNSLNKVVMATTTIIIRLTPYGVLGLMTGAATSLDQKAAAQLALFLVASYVGLIIILLIHLLILGLFKINIPIYIKKVLPVWLFAFSSRSSAATIPLNAETQELKLGVDKGISAMSASLGTTIGQNGCAGLYPAMVAIMVAVGTGTDITGFFIIKLIAIIAITSFGVAGIGGGATYAGIIVLSAMGLPFELAVILIGIEPLIDMGRTMINVNDSMVAGVVTAKRLDLLDEKTFRNQDNSIETLS